MPVSADFSHIAVDFYFWDWFSVLHGHLFNNFSFFSDKVYHFCNFLVLWGLLGCPIFLLVSSFGIFSRFGGGCIGSCGGSSWAWTLFVHVILSRIFWSSVEVNFCCFSIPPLVGQVFSVDVGFGISVLIAANFVSLGGFVFTW